MILTQMVQSDDGPEVELLRTSDGPTVAVYFGGVWSTLYLTPDEARAFASELAAAAEFDEVSA